MSVLMPELKPVWDRFKFIILSGIFSTPIRVRVSSLPVCGPWLKISHLKDYIFVPSLIHNCFAWLLSMQCIDMAIHTCTLEWVICNFFWYLCCFRQGFMRVTLRNKKHIGFICFKLITQRLALLAKVTVFGPKKWHFEWPNQNSKTTFIVQTFPKYGLYDFYLVNLSLLGAILAIFQFCGFSGLFWPFFPCNL